MEIRDRNRQIIKMRETHTYREIAERFNLSTQRVREIVNPTFEKQKWCEKHRHYFSDICIDCKMLKEYHEKIKHMSERQLAKEVEKITPYNRSKSEIIKREVLVKYYRDSFGLSFLELAQLFKRHHTTMIYLYYR